MLSDPIGQRHGSNAAALLRRDPLYPSRQRHSERNGSKAAWRSNCARTVGASRRIAARRECQRLKRAGRKVGLTRVFDLVAVLSRGLLFVACYIARRCAIATRAFVLSTAWYGHH